MKKSQFHRRRSIPFLVSGLNVNLRFWLAGALLVFAGIALILVPRLSSLNYRPRLQVEVLNVGQGSSAVVTCFDDSSAKPPVQVLIDAGESDDYYPDAEELFQRNLQKALGGDTLIEHAILSHPHRDHLFGFRRLLQSPNIRVQEFIDNGADLPGQQYEEELRRSVADRGIRYINVSRTPLPRISLCTVNGIPATLRFISLSEAAGQRLNCPSNVNNCSIVVQAELGAKRVLLAGDALTDWEAEISADYNLKSDVLVAGHHGHQSSSTAFLNAVGASAILVSTGKPECGSSASLGYPETETVERILSYLESKHAGTLPANGKSCETVLACSRSFDEKASCDWRAKACVPGFFSTAISGNVMIQLSSDNVAITTELPDRGTKSEEDSVDASEIHSWNFSES